MHGYKQQDPAPSADSKQQDPAPSADSKQQGPAPSADSKQQDPAPSADSKQKGPASPADDKSRWSSPPTIMAIAALIISIAGNLIQYIKTSNDLDVAMFQIRLQNDRWESERQKMEAEREKIMAELISLRQKDKLTQELADELQQINKQIDVWNQDIFETERQLDTEKNELQIVLNYPDAPNHTSTKKIKEFNIQTTENQLKTQKRHKDELITRRKEIEALLR